MNFNQRFEDWHKRAFGYVSDKLKNATAYDTRYKDTLCHARWEAWQASASNCSILGTAKQGE